MKLEDIEKIKLEEGDRIEYFFKEGQQTYSSLNYFSSIGKTKESMILYPEKITSKKGMKLRGMPIPIRFNDLSSVVKL